MTKGLRRAGCVRAGVRATSSLPVPVSPRMQTRVRSQPPAPPAPSRAAWLRPTRRSRACPGGGAGSRFSAPGAPSFSTFSTVSSSLSVESGFSRKSSAPSRVARTAISMCAWPDIITTGSRDALRLQIFEQRQAVLARHDDVGQNQVEGLRSWRAPGRARRCRRPWPHGPPDETRAPAKPGCSASSSTISKCAFWANVGPRKP